MKITAESTAARATIGILCVLLVAYVFWSIRTLLIDVFIAITIASAMTPLAELGQKKRIPRWITVALCYCAVAVFYTSIGFMLASPIKEQTTQFRENIPTYKAQLESKYRDLLEFIQHIESSAEQPLIEKRREATSSETAPLETHGEGTTDANTKPRPTIIYPTKSPPAGISNSAAPVGKDEILNFAVGAGRRAFDLSTGFFGAMVHVVLIIFLAGYFATAADGIWKSLLRWAPKDNQKELESLIEPLGQRMGGYIRGQLLVATAVGGFFAISYSLIGLNYAIVLGVLAGVLNLVPYVGSLTATALAIFIALNQNPVLIIAVILIAIIEQTIESNFFVPVLLGKQIDLDPLVVLFSVIIGAQLGGVPGVFVFVPLTSGLLYLADRYYLKRNDETNEATNE